MGLFDWVPTVPELTGEEAAKEASRTQKKTSDANVALQREMWETQRQDLAPWMQAGTAALGQMQNFRPPTWQLGEFEASPDYQFRLDQGTQALNRGAAAGGMRLSGRALMALQDYGQNMAGQEYGNWYGRQMQDYSRTMGESQDKWNRLAQLAGFGQGATSQAGQAGQFATGNIMQQNQLAANAQASAQMQPYYGQMNFLNMGAQGLGAFLGMG